LTNVHVIGAVTAAFTVVAMGLIGAELASAHSRPIRFDPPPGAVLATGPERVTGWFTAELRNDPNWTYIEVTDQNGARVDAGSIMLSTDRRQMSIGLRPGLSEGRYLVSWRGWDDADGAIFGDCYTFFVGQAAADAAVTSKTRLDGGNICQRIDVSARNGTPVAGGTPAATVTAAGGSATADHDDVPTGDTAATAGQSEDSDDGVPFWAVIAGIGVGMAVGLVGGRLLTGNR
jgi:methionine-rich copper-binding protein CopC